MSATIPHQVAGAEAISSRTPTPPASLEGGAWQLAHLLDGLVTTQLLYVAAALGIADVLADGPQSGPAIAAAVEADPAALTRVLRGLAAEDVLAETEDGRFALTPVGEYLGVLRGAALVRGELYYRSAAGLLDAVRAGGTPFEHVYGDEFFEHLSRNRGHEAAFQASMAGRAEQEADDVVAAYDVSGFGSFVDVGGGRGVLLARILGAAAGSSGVLIDRPAATRTCCPASSTTGTTRMPSASSWRAATRCGRRAGC